MVPVKLQQLMNGCRRLPTPLRCGPPAMKIWRDDESDDTCGLADIEMDYDPMPMPLADDPNRNVGGPIGSAAGGHAEGAAELKAEDGGWGISGSNPTITIPFAMVRSPSHVRP